MREHGRTLRPVIPFGLISFMIASGAAQAQTARISVDGAGRQANGPSAAPSTSADGRYTVFSTSASNLVAGDRNGHPDIVLRDSKDGRVRKLSAGRAGAGANNGSYRPMIAAGGRHVAFLSFASNIVGGDSNGVADIFVRDLGTGTLGRVSVSSSEAQANGESRFPSLSGDGRWVAFSSRASNLVGGDTNGGYDIFVRDRRAGTTSRVSVSSAEGQANGSSIDAMISADGRWVTFSSDASNLVANDTNAVGDVFLRNRSAGTTTRISVRTGGAQGNGRSYPQAITPDGRYVAFVSDASSLVPGDTNRQPDVFVHDRVTRATSRSSVASGGGQGNGASGSAALAANGQILVFRSLASNLVAGDTNNSYDVFVRDRRRATTRRVSLTSGGGQANRGCFEVAADADASVVAFTCRATNLVPGDTNSADDIFRIVR